MDNTKNIVIGAAVAGAAFLGGQATAGQDVQTVYVTDPARTVEVLRQLDLSKADLERLVPTVSVDAPVSVSYDASSTIDRYVIDEARMGNAPSTGILSVDETYVLYAKAAIESGAITDEERLTNVDAYQELRK